ncbi:hypothetical protein C8J57DRAFT_1581872 [Mycena rebaudengoi]|nr:hypothetical protein C8J57DRAFT_1581872 [Mycena rebaudengoi]
MSTPVLWTELCLDLSGLSPRPMTPGIVAELITAWFSRAGTLSFSFRATGFLRDQESLEFGLQTVIHHYVARLLFLQVYGGPGRLPVLPSGAVLPLLRELDLGSWSSFSDEPPIDAFRMAPLLQKLSLDEVPPFEYRGCKGNERASECSVSAPVLFKRGLRPLRRYRYARPRTNLAPLSSRVAGTSGCGSTHPLLPLPALEKLDIRGVVDDIFPPLFASLQTFTFGASTPAVSLPWIQYMEQLTTLELNSPEWPHKHELIRALNRAHQPQFLPKLCSLAFLQCEFEEVGMSFTPGSVQWTKGLQYGGGFGYIQRPDDVDESRREALNGRRSSIHTDELDKEGWKFMSGLKTKITSRSSAYYQL